LILCLPCFCCCSCSPRVSFKFDDVFSFDGPNPRPLGRGNETLTGWAPPTLESGEPLRLKIANALTSDWDEYFTMAIEDWEGAARVDGDADVLSLQTERLEADPACTPIEGVMKVCNNDYGATGWEGINECLIMGDFIISSVAKMNEYYLHPDKFMGLLQGSTATIQDKRRYTMCHEVRRTRRPSVRLLCRRLVASPASVPRRSGTASVSRTRTRLLATPI